MSTPKSWTAEGFNVGLMTIIRHTSTETGQDVITLAGNSHFVDGNGNAISELVPQRVSKELVWDNLPAEWKQVYNKLHDFIELELLKKHNME